MSDMSKVTALQRPCPSPVIVLTSRLDFTLVVVIGVYFVLFSLFVGWFFYVLFVLFVCCILGEGGEGERGVLDCFVCVCMLFLCLVFIVACHPKIANSDYKMIRDN